MNHLILLCHCAAAFNLIPPMPTQWPSIVPQDNFTTQLLNDPLVSDAYDYILAAVDKKYLDIPTSSVINGAVKYNGDPFANCYWPSNLCIRTEAIDQIPADISRCPFDNQWGLTFDDGPTESTPDLLSLLDSNQIKATFFQVGINALLRPSLVQSIMNSGHDIAAHTWRHRALTTLSNIEIVAEFRYTHAAIYKAIGKHPKYFRPPYGDIDDRVRAIAAALGYTTVIWSIDSNDSHGLNESVVVSTYRQFWNSGRSNGFVSLSHDVSSFTTNCAIEGLKEYFQNQTRTAVRPYSITQCFNTTAYRENNTINDNVVPVTHNKIVPTIDPINQNNAGISTSLLWFSIVLGLILMLVL